MRFQLLSGLVVSASLLAVGCGTDELEGPPPSVHEQDALPSPVLPHLESTLVPNVPRSSPVARTGAANIVLPGVKMRTDGQSGVTTAEVVSGARRLVQKTLLITASTGVGAPAYLAAKSSLDRMGVPYQVLVAHDATTGTLTGLAPSLLSDGVSTCNFNSVILATDSLGYADPTTGWTSAFNATDWQTLADFELACSAREAVWYAYPNPSLGLNWPTGSFDWMTPVNAVVTQPSFFAAVRSTASVPIRNAAGYLSTIADTSTTSLLEDGSGHVLMALHTFADGRQAIASTFDQSPYVVHSTLLEYDLIRWVTGGVFLGKKRAYLTAQIDDVFIEDDMWVIGAGNTGSTQRRIKGSDITSLVTWQNGLKASLPAGSSFATVMGFNGIGTRKTAYTDQSSLNASLAAGTAFLWLSHTWDHENLDAPLTQSAAYTEANKNINLAATYLFNGFSKTEIITPDVSGLGNLPALRGLWNAGVRFVVSNTSVVGGGNPSFNTGMANALEPRIFEVPRHPTNVFYDTATPAAQTDEYNHLYFPSFFLHPLSYDEMIDADSTIGAFYLFQGDIDPLMFHQPNLANYNAGTTQPPHSLYGDWVSAVVGKFLAVSTAPIATLQQRDIAAAMQQRSAYNTCGVTATIVESTAGPRTLELTSTGACTVPVTGVSAPTAGSVEPYLGSATTSIAMTAGTTTSVPLP